MASNIVEILIGARDDAKLDLDSLKAKLTELAHTVAEARAGVKGDKEAEARLDQLGAKLIKFGHRTENAKIGLEGQFKLMAELGAVGVAIDRVKAKADGGGSGGLVGAFRNLAMGGSTALENLGAAGTTFINPITIALAGLAAIIAGPLLASLLPISVGFVAFGGVAVHEITKIITAHQKLQAAQAAYAKASTPAGQASALKAEHAALAGLSGPEKQVMGLMNQLGNEFHKLSKAVQPQVVKAFGSALKILKDIMPALKPLAKAAGDAIDKFLNNIDKWLKSDSGKKFLKWMETDGPKAIQRFGDAMWILMQVVGRVFDFLKNAGETWWRNVHQVFHDVRVAWDTLTHAFDTARHTIAHIFDDIKSTVGSAIDWITGKIHDLTGALGSINGALGGIPGKILSGLGFAAGGIAGAASGGLRSNLTMVGEHGPELVQLSAGSRVYNNAQTRDMMSGASGGNSYSISVQVAPGGHPAETGRQIVNLIREFERGSGKGWRS